MRATRRYVGTVNSDGTFTPAPADTRPKIEWDYPGFDFQALGAWLLGAAALVLLAIGLWTLGGAIVADRNYASCSDVELCKEIVKSEKGLKLSERERLAREDRKAAEAAERTAKALAAKKASEDAEQAAALEAAVLERTRKIYRPDVAETEVIGARRSRLHAVAGTATRGDGTACTMPDGRPGRDYNGLGCVAPRR